MAGGLAYGECMNIPQPENSSRPATVRRWLAPAVIVALMAVGYGLGLHRYLSLDVLASNRESLRNVPGRPFAEALLLFILLYAVAVALSISGGDGPHGCGRPALRLVFRRGGRSHRSNAGRHGNFPHCPLVLWRGAVPQGRRRLQKLRQGFDRDAFSYLLFLVWCRWLVNLTSP